MRTCAHRLAAFVVRIWFAQIWILLHGRLQEFRVHAVENACALACAHKRVCWRTKEEIVTPFGDAVGCVVFVVNVAHGSGVGCGNLWRWWWHWWGRVAKSWIFGCWKWLCGFCRRRKRGRVRANFLAYFLRAQRLSERCLSHACRLEIRCDTCIHDGAEQRQADVYASSFNAEADGDERDRNRPDNFHIHAYFVSSAYSFFGRFDTTPSLQTFHNIIMYMSKLIHHTLLRWCRRAENGSSRSVRSASSFLCKHCIHKNDSDLIS